MEIIEEDKNGVLVIDLKGKLDSTNAVDFGNRLRDILAQTGRRLLLNLQHIEYISSAGFRTLLIASRHATRNSSQMVLTDLAPKVKDLFELCGFLDNFQIYSSREQGIAALS